MEVADAKAIRHRINSIWLYYHNYVNYFGKFHLSDLIRCLPLREAEAVVPTFWGSAVAITIR